MHALQRPRPHLRALQLAWSPSPTLTPTHTHTRTHTLQAIEEETERADEVHAREQEEQRRRLEEHAKDVEHWKVQCFHHEYERCAGRGVEGECGANLLQARARTIPRLQTC